jgi:hypothetical protein
MFLCTRIQASTNKWLGKFVSDIQKIPCKIQLGTSRFGEILMTLLYS